MALPESAPRIDLGRLREVQEASEAFLDRHPRAFLILDGLGSLVRDYGEERVVRWIGALHEAVAVRAACLVAFVDPGETSPRFLAWLARELDPLPRGETAAELPAAAA